MKGVGLLVALAISANAWTFNISDIKGYSEHQKEVLRVSYIYGYSKDLAFTIATLAIVESRAGIDNHENHVCGAHQLNTEFTSASCEALESNPLTSAIEGTENFLWWYKYTRGNWRKALQHYNAGFKLTRYKDVYLKRCLLVYRELQNNKELFFKYIDNK